MGIEIEKEVRIHALAGIHPDPALVPGRVVARILKSFPRTFQKESMLRIDNLGLFPIDVEESSVEHFQVIQHGVGFDIFGMVDQSGGNAFGRHLLVGKEGDRFHPRTQIFPELSDVPGPGKARGDADHGNLAKMCERIRLTHLELLASRGRFPVAVARASSATPCVIPPARGFRPARAVAVPASRLNTWRAYQWSDT